MRILAGWLVQVAAFPALAASMDDRHFLVGTQGGLAVTQDALGKRLGMTEFLIKIVIITSLPVTIVHVGHHAAVTGNPVTTLALIITDGALVLTLLVKAAGTALTTVIITAAGTPVVALAATAGIVIALATLTGTEALVADVLSTLAHFIIPAVKDDVLQQLTIQAAIIELVAHRRFQADLVGQFIVIADEPHVVTLESVLELVTHVLVQRLDILGIEALAVGRIADEGAAGRNLVDVIDVAALDLDILVQARTLDVGARDGNGFALDVATVNLVCKLAFLAIVVVDLIKQVGVIVGPLLESIVIAINTGSDVGGNQSRLDEERARSTHRVNEVGLSIPAAQQNDASSQHLIDGCIGLSLAPAALE